MIILRNAVKDDVSQIAQLTSVPGFLNLKGSEDEISLSIEISEDSFYGRVKNVEDCKFIFVAEDTTSKKVVGVSMIASKHGTLESPHFYFQVEEEEKFSQTIKRGFIHKTIELKYETEGPSEIGSLVINPEYRNTQERVGKQISYVRFLYAGIFKNKFQKKIIAELLPPLNKAGKSPLWEAVGRRFTEMDYWEADLLCQKNKEFIFSLFPQEKIYLTFLSREAQRAVGGVGEATRPAFHMLKKMGFSYFNQVDPFDGGPHLWGEIDELFPVKNLKTFHINFNAVKKNTVDQEKKISGLISPVVSSGKNIFESVFIEGVLGSDESLILDFDFIDQLKKTLNMKNGDQVYFCPYI